LSSPSGKPTTSPDLSPTATHEYLHDPFDEGHTLLSVAELPTEAVLRPSSLFQENVLSTCILKGTLTKTGGSGLFRSAGVSVLL
jgi:hypothetical protein